MKRLDKYTYTLETLEVYKAELEAQNIELLEKEEELKDRALENENLSMFLNWISDKDFLKTSITLELTMKDKKEIFKVQANEYAHDKNLIMLSMFSIQKEIDLFEATQKKDKL